MWVFPVSKVQLLTWECSNLFPPSPTHCSSILELQTPQRRMVPNNLHAFFSFFLLSYSSPPPSLLIPPRKIDCARYNRCELSREELHLLVLFLWVIVTRCRNCEQPKDRESKGNNTKLLSMKSRTSHIPDSTVAPIPNSLSPSATVLQQAAVSVLCVS